MPDYSLLRKPEPNKFVTGREPWDGTSYLQPGQTYPWNAQPSVTEPVPETRQTSNFSKAPAYIDAFSPGGVLYQRSPERAAQELQRLQEREMKKVRQIETMSPGMGVGYWNRNPVLSKVGSLEMTDDNGVNVYALNGQPIAYGSRGSDNTYSVSRTRPDQAGGKTPAPAQAAGQQASSDKIERSRGRYERPQQTVLGLAYGYDIGKLPGGPVTEPRGEFRAEFRAAQPTVPVPRAPQERPRETVLGVENVPAQSSNVHPQFRKAPWIGERIAQDVAAAADVPKTLLRQMIAFPAAKVGGALAALAGGWGYPAEWLASKVTPSLVEPPRNPLETGRRVERGVYDYVAQPNAPRAELTTRAVDKINKIPPLQLANKPFEGTQGIRDYLTERGYSNAGYAVGTLGDLALLGGMGKGAKAFARYAEELPGYPGFSKTLPMETPTAESFIASRSLSKRPQFLTQYAPEQMKDFRLFKVRGQDAGYAIKPDGDLVNVFNNSGISNVGKAAVHDAIRKGATKLDAYQGFLTDDYYPQFGFKEVRREQWNPRFKPEGWLEEDGTPAVVFMELPKRGSK